MEERFNHIETEEQMEPLQAENQEQMRVIRDMTIEQHRVLPNDRMRHWMLAQSHLINEDGQMEIAEREARVQEELGQPVLFKPPTEADKERSKRAYDVISDQLSKRDMTGDALLQDFLSEKAMDLDRFADQEEMP